MGRIFVLPEQLQNDNPLNQVYAALSVMSPASEQELMNSPIVTHAELVSKMLIALQRKGEAVRAHGLWRIQHSLSKEPEILAYVRVDRKTAVLEDIENNPGITAVALASRHKVSTARIRQILGDLTRQGRIVSTQQDRVNHYSIPEAK